MSFATYALILMVPIYIFTRCVELIALRLRKHEWVAVLALLTAVNTVIGAAELVRTWKEFDGVTRLQRSMDAPSDLYDTVLQGGVAHSGREREAERILHGGFRGCPDRARARSAYRGRNDAGDRGRRSVFDREAVDAETFTSTLICECGRRHRALDHQPWIEPEIPGL